jgi:hypothetical protein
MSNVGIIFSNEWLCSEDLVLIIRHICSERKVLLTDLNHRFILREKYRTTSKPNRAKL